MPIITSSPPPPARRRPFPSWAKLLLIIAATGGGASWLVLHGEQQKAEAAGRAAQASQAARLAREAEFAAAIAAKKVLVGMSPAQVEAAWGPPRSRTVSDGVGARQDFLHYESQTLYFVDGALVRWTTR